MAALAGVLEEGGAKGRNPVTEKASQWEDTPI